MLKKRMLLLVASLAAFGAVMVSGAFANNTGSATTAASGTITNRDVQGDVTAALANQVTEVRANGLFAKVADIQAYQSGPLYPAGFQIRTTSESTTNGGSSGNCGAGHTYAIDNPGSVVGLTGAWQNITALMLSISPSADETCTVSGAVVTVNYEAY
ncbi:MAG: hypothetical protein C0506_07830 [Anaerolinea sp.]|nr:hypothetical protein [Anaerolinea sp.]